MSEQKFWQDEEDTICRSMLHLSTAADDYPTTSTATDPYKTTSEKYAAMTVLCSSGKRAQSPVSFQEPPPKRPNFNSDHHHLTGLTKLPLQQSFTLRRTFSEPIEALNFEAPPPQFSQLPQNSLLNQERSGRNSGQESVPFPNPPPPLIHPTVSDPCPVSNGQVVAATPPRPPRPRNFSQSPSSIGESSTNKRLKRIKERMREMSHWWNQLLREQEEDDEDQSDSHTCHPTEESESGMENPAQEAVWVEKNGDCLVLHFRCPCGNGYQILLIGNTCYYKLTTF